MNALRVFSSTASIMKMKAMVGICVLLTISSIALVAQTNTTPLPLITPPTSGSKTVTELSGLVTVVRRDTVTIKTEAANPVSFALAKSVKYADRAGNEIQADRIRPGARVRVVYEGNEDTRTATRIILEE